MANTVRCRAAISRESAHRGITTRQTLEGPSVHSRASGNPVRFPLAWNLSAVISGRAEGASPESITTGGDYGFRAPSLRSRPGMTAERLAQTQAECALVPKTWIPATGSPRRLRRGVPLAGTNGNCPSAPSFGPMSVLAVAPHPPRRSRGSALSPRLRRGERRTASPRACRRCDRLLDGLRRAGQPVELDPERAQRLTHAIGTHRRRRNGPAFADAFDAERIERRRRMLVDQLHARYFPAGRPHLAPQRPRDHLAL